ncbi:hypothetical protein ARMGADRAFT_420508 [Armillaria gallica]|uniref:F-box domain-containing protein n=1 Tax=Armillaria gallica TaxID=47427 RepID=A0A2H3E1H1_ARMGA|nr:hypothetical protein ARMGADRAFT_420508 [Armillaria gallica]
MAQNETEGKKQDEVPTAPNSNPPCGELRPGETTAISRSRINELLPNELLTYIFATAIISLLPKEHTSFLALVCSICRRWRDVAIEASELWTTIYIHHQNDIPAAELFLKRSKTQLLDVDVQVGNFFSQDRFQSPTESSNRRSGLRVAELTSVHLERTRSLSLSVSDTLVGEKFSALYWPMPTPHLVNLSVNVKGWSQSVPPLLDSICSFHSNGNDGSSSTTASSSNLTRLELISPFTEHEDLRNIFTHFPSLETLILPKFDQGWGEDQGENRPIILAPSSLRSLAVHLDYAHVKTWRAAGNSRDCSCILGSLHFPNLEYLEVRGEEPDCNLSLSSHFKDLPKLKTLRLQRCSVPPLDDKFFRSLKLLNRLELVENVEAVDWSSKLSKMALPFPHLSSIFLGSKSLSRRSNMGMTQWARLAQLSVQNYGCTQFSIKVTAKLHRMTSALGFQDERIRVEVEDHPPGFHLLPPGNFQDWLDEDNGYRDYAVDLYDYDNQDLGF